MRHRWLRLTLILLWSVWLGVIIPGHERGAVALPGSQTSMAQGAALVQGSEADVTQWRAVTPCCSRAGTTGNSEDPVRHCAICRIVATLDLPITINHDAPALGLRFEPPDTAVAVVHPFPTVTLHSGRAPPRMHLA